MSVRGSSWVCLMYHDITEHTCQLSGGPSFFSVPATAFARQLSLIHELGLRGCSIAGAIAQPDGAIAISFDDGDVGQASRAFPALAQRGMSATFFVTTAWVGRPRYASWAQLREMRAAGMSIESHTHSHPFLSELDHGRLRDELRRSREMLDERLDQRTTMLALPGGDAPRRALRPMLFSEYEVIATSRWGRNSARSTSGLRWVKRCMLRGTMSDVAFASIATADRWMAIHRRTRESLLAFLRSSVGPSRYARWRRRVLDAAGGRMTDG